MRPLQPDDLVRGQYAGYRKESNVAKSSDVETFCALRLFIDSWRWEGVPWYLRAGKFLAETDADLALFQQFQALCTRIRARLQQTRFAFLLPPKARSKGRFLNVSQQAQ